MTFWGVIVKPGEPYTHKVNKERSRLRVATLGDEVSGAEGRTVLKCKVGDSEPISLCNLLCGNSETMNLNIEFDEETDVLFTVIGSCSVHISGNYLKNHAGSGGTSSDTNSDDTTSSNSDDSTSSRSATMGKVVRHVTMNVKDAPKIDLMSDDSKSLSTDSPKAPKKPKFKKRKRAKLH